MSDKTRREERWLLTHRVWKVQDDRSGFVEYSHNMIIDHRGRVCRPEYADPIHPFEIAQPPIEDSPHIGVCRPDPLRGLQADPGESEIDVESI